MKNYERLWWLVAISVGAMGAVEGLLAVTPRAAWVARIAVGMVSGLGSFAFAVRQNRQPGYVCRVVLAAATGVGAEVVLAGLTSLLGGAVVATAVAILCCLHPRVLGGTAGWTRRWLRQDGDPRTRGAVWPRPSTPAPPYGGVSRPDPEIGASTRPRDWASKVIPRTPPPDPGWPDAAGLRLLSASQLCWGWRASFSALERTDPRLDQQRWTTLIAVRRGYLDEIARRDPVGLARWLYSGARPASDPSRYLLVVDERPTTDSPARATSLGPEAPADSDGDHD